MEVEVKRTFEAVLKLDEADMKILAAILASAGNGSNLGADKRKFSKELSMRLYNALGDEEDEDEEF